MKQKSRVVNVIGAGFAGIECALFLARQGIDVHIFDKEMGAFECECASCDVSADNLKDKIAKNLLREELKLLDSSLIDEEFLLSKKGNACLSKELLYYARQLLKSNPKIRIFNQTITEIDPKQINVIASGPKTDDRFFDKLSEMFGSLRCNDLSYVDPIINNIDIKQFRYKENDDENIYLPFSYQEYLDLCNKIIKQRNDFLMVSQLPRLMSRPLTIEKIVEHDKDAVRNQVMRICMLTGQATAPYSVLKLKKVMQGYEVCGFASELPRERQLTILRSIKGMESCSMVRSGDVKEDKYINSPFMLNKCMQSNKNTNTFFAGGITGLVGHLECMASGLYVGYCVASEFNEKKQAEFPPLTCIGTILNKIITITTSKFTPLTVKYDIIKSEKTFPDLVAEKNFLLKNSMFFLTKFKEDYYGRRNNA